MKQVHHAQWAILRGQAARALRLSNEVKLAAAFEAMPFDLWEATNGFGDNFELLLLSLPRSKYLEMEKDADTYRSKTQYEKIAQALEGVGNQIRFIGMDAVEDSEMLTPSASIRERTKPRSKGWSPNGWTLETALGEGGQGWTYLVRRTEHSDQNLYVAKRLKNKGRLARFQAEINALKKLSHSGILKIVETGDSEDVPFYIAEYCENGDLSKSDLSGKTLLQKLRLYREICDAMAAAHGAKIIHRDLKPPNVLIRRDGTIAVGDFGLCLDLTDIEERLTSTSEAVGARHYIAPELEDGRSVDPKPSSDVYSLGKLLYYILSGRSFSREQHRIPFYDLLHSSLNSIDPHLYFVYELLDKTIDSNSGARYQNAAELRDALDGVIMRIEQNAHVLDITVPQHCLYCIIGQYQRTTGAISGEIRLICMNCGNVQIFAGRRAWLDTR